MNAACRDIIALSLLEGLGPVKIKALLGSVRDTEEIFSMSGSRLFEILGARFKETGRIRSVRDSDELKSELEYMKREGIKAVCCIDGDYPESLKNIYDPPPVIFCKGDIRALNADAIAIVGARRCSLYGIQTAEKIAGDLAGKGITVVSGMARGIDSAAHRGALRAGGSTVAVMGSGFKHIYPPEAEKSIQEISAGGAVITEYTSNVTPHRSNFPRRNRIISALAKGVVVVEANSKSGALITVDFALEQGREVFAVPGRIDFNTSRGTNKLIQDGAKLITTVDDILEELNLEPAPVHHKKEHAEASSDEEAKVLGFLSDKGPAHIDGISSDTGIKLDLLSEVLLKLEMKGAVKALAGARYRSEGNKVCVTS